MCYCHKVLLITNKASWVVTDSDEMLLVSKMPHGQIASASTGWLVVDIMWVWLLKVDQRRTKEEFRGRDLIDDERLQYG